MRCRSISACLSTVAISSLLAAQDFGFLHLDLLLLLDLLNLDRFGDDLLLHDVRLDFVGLVGLRLLPLHRLEVTAPS